MSPVLSVRELSARGRGAIRVLELRGVGEIVRQSPRPRGRPLAAGLLAPRRWRDARGELLDEAVVLAHAEDRVELQLHGAPTLVARVARELGAGADGAAPRSIEERAEELLAGAASEAAARMLLDQAEGALRAELSALLALEPHPMRAAARELARRGRVARWLVQPPRVVLGGPVNAGKSTLFNLLVGRERVLVDPAAGTTRDAVVERVSLGAYAIELVDTAGERVPEPGAEGSEIEGAGQALAAELRRAADLVLWLVPPGEAPPPTAERLCVVHSRADLAPEGATRTPAISALRAPTHARGVVEDAVHAALDLPRAPWGPGRGVPFEPEWTERLARAEPDELACSVRAWLGPPGRAGAGTSR